MAADDYDTEAPPSGGPAVSDLFRKLTGWYKEDIGPVQKWRKEAREDFDFYAGNQWSEEDREKLRKQKRPELTFNRTAPLVNAIVGSEINNRREIRFIPREQGDAQANEVLSAGAEWFRDECGAEDEESDAWKSTVIAGMGWTDTYLDFTDEPDGAPKIEKMDAMEMVWDRNSVKPNLADAQRMFRVRKVSYDEAAELTGEKDRSKLHAAWAESQGDTAEPHDQDQADMYSGTQDPANPLRKKCIIVEARWLEKEVYYRGPDMQAPGQIKEYATKQYDALNKMFKAQSGRDFPAVRQTRKVVRRAFIGADVLGEPDKPMVPPGMFGWECITGYKDETENRWYGVLRAAKDPSRWSNKFFSQVMYLLNSQSKGGIMAEKGAFDDPRQAEATWTRSDAITVLKDGALSGQNPKVVPKPSAQFPAGFFTLFQEAKEAISQVTGLSMEFIGTREADQAGVLEYQRRQSSLNLLAELFNSLRRYRKRQGRTMLYLIQEHLADGRLVRIVGDGLKQYVPLTKASVADRQYDIIIDDSPSSPNEKDRTWQILMQMLPMVKDLMTPEVAIELLSISPLPASLVDKLKKKAAEQAAQPKPPTPEEQKMQASQQKHQLDMAGKQADIQAKQAENQMDVQMKGIDLMMKQQEMQLDRQRDEQEFVMDMRRAAVQERQNAIASQRANSQRTSAAR